MAACTLPAVPPGMSSCPQNEQTPLFFRLKDPEPASHESAPLRDFKGHQRAFCTGVSLDVNKEGTTAGSVIIKLFINNIK